jgi:hypothetical protein
LLTLAVAVAEERNFPTAALQVMVALALLLLDTLGQRLHNGY